MNLVCNNGDASIERLTAGPPPSRFSLKMGLRSALGRRLALSDEVHHLNQWRSVGHGVAKAVPEVLSSICSRYDLRPLGRCVWSNSRAARPLA